MSATLKYEQPSLARAERPSQTRRVVAGLSSASSDPISAGYLREPEDRLFVWSGKSAVTIYELPFAAAPMVSLPDWGEFKPLRILAWPAASVESEEQRQLTGALRRALNKARSVAAIDGRLTQLRLHAAEEGGALSERSRACMLNFLEAIEFTVTPKIFLLDSGNLRAVWRSRDEQVALEFLDGGGIRYVFFAARPKPVHVARSAGFDDLAHILEQIHVLGLAHLLEND